MKIINAQSFNKAELTSELSIVTDFISAEEFAEFLGSNPGAETVILNNRHGQWSWGYTTATYLDEAECVNTDEGWKVHNNVEDYIDYLKEFAEACEIEFELPQNIDDIRAEFSKLGEYESLAIDGEGDHYVVRRRAVEVWDDCTFKLGALVEVEQ